MASPRFATLDRSSMTPEQGRVADALMNGPRKGMNGPHNAWLRRPELADRFQKVGEYILYQTILSPRLRELAIITTARRWDSQFEWHAHRRLALEAGLDVAIADALERGERPASFAADERIVFDFTVELMARGEVSDETYEPTLALLGEEGVIDLVGSIAYYTAVALTLNVDRHPVPAGARLLMPMQDGFEAAMSRVAQAGA